jgi:hypothetical protein
VFWLGGVSAAEMYASAKQSPLIVCTALRLAKLLRLFRGRTAEKVLIFLGIGALACLPCLPQARSDIQPMQSLALAAEDSASPHSKCSRESPRTTSRSRASCGHPRARMAWSLFLEPSCRFHGSFRNYLVYLPPARTVKKTRG